MKGIITSFFAIMLVIGFLSCGDNESPGESETDNYDRAALLVDIADNVIIPGYEAYASSLATFDQSIQAFVDSPTTSTLAKLKEDYIVSYTNWQSVSMFEIGKAEVLSLRNNTNIFPTNAQEITENIESGIYNLELPSKIDEQGFPAIDYLIYGVADTDIDVVLYYSDNENAKQYLLDLSTRLLTMADLVLGDWNTGYRETFIDNDGSTATSSLNKIVNDYLFYYEKFLRAGKVGIPAGVFSGSSLPNSVETFYSDTNSKLMFLTALNATKNFFIGQSSHSDGNGESLKSYLDFLDKDGNTLSDNILTQFDNILIKADGLNDSFSSQVEDNNSLMLETYDELQKNVVLLKVDMLQALNIKVDFVDADGD